MDYRTFLEQSLAVPSAGAEIGTVVDIFAGCGGLSLGFEAAGFKVVGYEMDKYAAETYRRNLKGYCHQQRLTPETLLPRCDVLIGGPPCQPFSVLGFQRGMNDPRNGLEIFVKYVEQLRPKVWLFENVAGLAEGSKSYLLHVLRRLKAMGYVIADPNVLNAKDYGVPQNRKRLVVVGCKGRRFDWPEQHPAVRTSRAAIGRTAARVFRDSRFLTDRMSAYIKKYETASCCKTPRDLDLDLPSRTLTCRNLGGATGDMMRVRLRDGRRRLLSVTEAAALQSFPPSFRFFGSFTSKMSQIGNAVPPLMALALAGSIRAIVED